MHVSQFNDTICTMPEEDYTLPLGPECPLLARKFGPETADVVTDIIRASDVLRHTIQLFNF